jgi:hypothetical protein
MIITLTGCPCEPSPPCEKSSLPSALAGPDEKAAHAASAKAHNAPSERVSIMIFLISL